MINIKKVYTLNMVIPKAGLASLSLPLIGSVFFSGFGTHREVLFRGDKGTATQSLSGHNRETFNLFCLELAE